MDRVPGNQTLEFYSKGRVSDVSVAHIDFQQWPQTHPPPNYLVSPTPFTFISVESEQKSVDKREN